MTACRVRRACDDAPLSVPVRLYDAPYYLLAVAGRLIHPTSDDDSTHSTRPKSGGVGIRNGEQRWNAPSNGSGADGDGPAAKDPAKKALLVPRYDHLGIASASCRKKFRRKSWAEMLTVTVEVVPSLV